MNNCQHPVLHEKVGEPLPMRRHGRRRPPVEDQGDRDPWLPPAHPYPEISRTLRTMSLALLVLVVFFTTVLFVLWAVAR